MALTRTEEFILSMYRSYLDRPPSFMNLLKAAARRMLNMAVASGFLGTLFYSYGYRQSGCLLYGIGIGAIARQIGQIRVAVVGARLLARIVDRDRIEQLLNEDQSS